MSSKYTPQDSRFATVLVQFYMPESMINTLGRLKTWIQHSADDIIHGLHGKMPAPNSLVGVVRVYVDSQPIARLLQNDTDMYPDSGSVTFFYNSQLFHSLNFLFVRSVQSDKNSARRIKNLNLSPSPLTSRRPSKHIISMGSQTKRNHLFEGPHAQLKPNLA